MTILRSVLDSSVNFIEDALTGFIETRYVRRNSEYFIAYLSSQTGCNRGCRFCHLTTTKQTKFENVTFSQLLKQSDVIFDEYKASGIKAKYVHFNFMARGEPLNNPNIDDHLLTQLGLQAINEGLFPKFNISTIIPRDFSLRFKDIFRVVYPTIYYSIYSIKETFRRKWLPNAMPPDEALELLAEYQRLSKKLIKFHCAFIKGENDSRQDVTNMMWKIEDYGIKGEFNIVRYNPYSPEQGEETTEEQLEQIRLNIATFMPVKVIPRVGQDVKASCGTFV